MGVLEKPQRDTRKWGGEYIDIFLRNSNRERKLGLKEVKEKMCRISG